MRKRPIMHSKNFDLKSQMKRSLARPRCNCEGRSSEQHRSVTACVNTVMNLARLFPIAVSVTVVLIVIMIIIMIIIIIIISTERNKKNYG
jgi:lipopolysaccharide/colanic/teichoic acid biosynthesis glycosyltransferase